MHFRLTRRCSGESVESFETENVSMEGDFNRQSPYSRRMLYHLSYRGKTFPIPCFEHWLWWYFSIIKLIFGISTVHMQKHLFSTPERMFLIRCRFWVFETRNVSTHGRLKPPSRWFVPNNLPIEPLDQPFPISCLEWWVSRYRYFPPWSAEVYIFTTVRLFVCLSLRPSVYLSVCLSAYASLCLSIRNIMSKRVNWFSWYFHDRPDMEQGIFWNICGRLFHA